MDVLSWYTHIITWKLPLVYAFNAFRIAASIVQSGWAATCSREPYSDLLTDRLVVGFRQ